MGGFLPNKGITDFVRDAAKTGIEESARAVEKRAKSLAPVRKIGNEGKGYRYRRYSADEAKAASKLKMWKSIDPNDRPNFRTAYRRTEAHRVSPFNRTLLQRQTVFPDKGKTGISGFAFTARSKEDAARWTRTLARMNRKAQLDTIRGAALLQGRFGDKFDMTSEEESRGHWGPFIPVQSKVGSGKPHTVFQFGGRLKRDIEYDGQPRQSGKKLIATVISGAPYSKYVEFPTRRTKAQPFLMPALKEERGKMLDRVAKHMRAELKG